MGVAPVRFVLSAAGIVVLGVAAAGCGGGASQGSVPRRGSAAHTDARSSATEATGEQGAAHAASAPNAGTTTTRNLEAVSTQSPSSRGGRGDGASGARRPNPPRISVVREPMRASSHWRLAARVDGRPAAWVAHRGAVTLLRLDQHVVHLVLHAGSEEPGAGGWPGGDEIGRRQAPTVLAGFNGGFRLNLPMEGFAIGGRVGVPLQTGLASIVTYSKGRTAIGSWRSQVPIAGRKIASVRQNLHLLIDGGRPASNLESCVQECWGATLGGGTYVARSALGITGDGQLVWAGGEYLSPADIAHALLGAGVRRAVELDINPEWVAAYLYRHNGAGHLSAKQVVPGQPGIPGQLLSPYNRDFFTVVANRGARPKAHATEGRSTR